MGFEVWRGKSEFDHLHEKEAAERTIRALEELYEESDEFCFLVLNFHCEGEDFDAVVLKQRAILIIDFKDCNEPIVGGVNGNWHIKGDSNAILNEGRRNPYQQVRDYRFALMRYLHKHRSSFLEPQKATQASFEHVSAAVCITPDKHPESEFDIDFGKKPWFHVVGLPELANLVRLAGSPQISLSEMEARTFVRDVLHCVSQPTRGRLADHPITFRRELVDRIMRSIVAGESCSVVGVASTGKSNLFRFLVRPQVRKRYLGESWDKYLFLYIDTNSLTELSEWGLYKLVLWRIVEAIEGLKVESRWSKLFSNLYQQAVLPEKRPLAQSYLEWDAKNLCQRLGFKLVFLFDEFDEIFRQVDTRFFLNLRALRDEHKYRLSYVVATRDELSRIRENVGECESFYELFSPNTYGLGPYDHADAKNMIHRLAARRGLVVTDDDTNLLIEFSGRHPGLLRAAFWALTDQKIDTSGDIFRQLSDNPDIQAECAKIWDSIGEDERMALADVAAGCQLQQLEQGVSRLLQLKGLVTEGKAGQVTIFCRLFQDFVNQQEIVRARDIRLDKRSGKVWVEGRAISPDLTAEEFNLLSYLFERRGEICSKSELEALFYPEEQDVYTLVNQLRKKIESDPRRPKYVITARGRGFKLARATPEQS